MTFADWKQSCEQKQQNKRRIANAINFPLLLVGTIISPNTAVFKDDLSVINIKSITLMQTLLSICR